MKIFISGGCKNGKSTHAQKISQGLGRPDSPLYYLATMIPTDKEDEVRIDRHRKEREGCGFETVEAGRNILTAVGNCDKSGTFLLDSVTALLANEMFAPDGQIQLEAYIKVADDLTKLLHLVKDIVIVSDFICSDAFLYDKLTESYRRSLAYIDRQMANHCDVVLEACAGVYIAHKGKDFLKGLSCEIS